MTPDAEVFREKVHTRTIELNGYRRSDGLWDIEGHLKDVRHHDIVMRSEVRPAGAALHEMVVVITVDDELNIRAARAETRASPYPGTCENIAPDYAGLVGLRVAGGFKKELARLFGGLRGCTHITELLGSMATAAMQTVGPHIEKTSTERPAKLDGCHALDSSGPIVAYHYPTWHRKVQ